MVSDYDGHPTIRSGGYEAYAARLDASRPGWEWARPLTHRYVDLELAYLALWRRRQSQPPAGTTLSASDQRLLTLPWDQAKRALYQRYMDEINAIRARRGGR